MENKKTIAVEFWQKVKYYAEIQVTEEQFQLLEDLDGDDIKMYDREYNVNPAYELLQNHAREDNECDWDLEYEDFAMKDLK